MRPAPETTADGGWGAGPHRRLSPEQNAEASKACADLADEGRRDILPALKRVESAEKGRHLAGLRHMLKGEDRLKEKIADELAAPGVSVREALTKVCDPVRYTFTYTPQPGQTKNRAATGAQQRGHDRRDLFSRPEVGVLAADVFSRAR